MARGALKNIYAVRSIGGQGLIKIGCSTLVGRRLMQLAYWSPLPLEIAATIPGTHDDERDLHNFLGDAYSHHEWFRPTPEVLRVVAMMKIGAPIADILATFNSCPFPRPERGGTISWRFRRPRAAVPAVREAA